MYRVISTFRDIQDKMYLYRVGDTFPRDGKTVTAERIAALASGANKAKRPLIEEIIEETKEQPKPAKKPAKRTKKKV